MKHRLLLFALAVSLFLPTCNHTEVLLTDDMGVVENKEEILNGDPSESGESLKIIRVTSSEPRGYWKIIEEDDEYIKIFIPTNCVTCSGTILSHEDNITYVLTDKHCTHAEFLNCNTEGKDCPESYFL